MRRLVALLLIVTLLGLGLFAWLRPEEAVTAVGPAVALCPGPDLYGYTCADGTAFAYIDASQDSGLQLDDGATRTTLPFPFVFYGTTYEEVWLGSNGVLQFGRQNPRFDNLCLDDGPAPEMGDMIAPYWDDLDLSFAGALETEVVGEAPDRIFVVEWDEVAPYGRREESLTFAVQLHEGSNDIVFLYPDTSTTMAARGSSATVGVQSEAQGLVLQYSCNQAVIADGSSLHFEHPPEPNDEIGMEAVVSHLRPDPVEASQLKGIAAVLQERLQDRGRSALPALRRHWLSQPEPLLFSWQWHDLDGDGEEELVGLWGSFPGQAEEASLAIFAVARSEKPGIHLATEPLFAGALSNREVAFARPELQVIVDLTGDGMADVLLKDRESSRVAAITFTGDGALLHHLPDACEGRVIVDDVDRDGVPDLLWNKCGAAAESNAVYTWQKGVFARLAP